MMQLKIRYTIMITTLLAAGTLLALIIVPTLAQEMEGIEQIEPEMHLEMPGIGQIESNIHKYYGKRIREFRITGWEGMSWCDVRIDHDIESTPQIDCVTLTTRDPKINAVLLTAWTQDFEISVEAHGIPKPPGREWGRYDTQFYEIDVVYIVKV